MVTAEGLSKIYRSRSGSVEALKDVSLTFGDKGLVFILGKSGSGKTTLMNALGGLDVYDGGKVYYNGVDTSALSNKKLTELRKKDFGYVFQDFLLFDDLSVEDNLRVAAAIQGGECDTEAALEAVGLGGLGKRKPRELSTGQNQRVGIARALVKNSKVIFADEPTGNLDSGSGETVFALLKKLSADKLVIAVSHDEEAALKYADRIIRIADGRITGDQIIGEEKGAGQ